MMKFLNTRIKRMFKNKRGISPLIATVLLIAFAVALGAVVMNWGRSYIESTQTSVQEQADTEITCSTNVKIAAVSVGSTTKICYNDTSHQVKFIIENTGRQTIKKLKVQIINTNNTVNSTTIVQDIEPGELYSGTASYTGSFQQLRIVPIIMVGQSYVTCSNAAKSFDTTTIHECP